MICEKKEYEESIKPLKLWQEAILLVCCVFFGLVIIEAISRIAVIKW